MANEINYNLAARNVLKRALKVAALRDDIEAGRDMVAAAVQIFIDAAGLNSPQYDPQKLKEAIVEESKKLYARNAERFKQGSFRGFSDLSDLSLTKFF